MYKILADGNITKEEYSQFMKATLADGQINPEESEQINCILLKIRDGEVEVEK